MTKDKKTKQEVFGEVTLDLGKLTFGGIVLAGIFNSSVNKLLLIVLGGLFCITAILLGIYWTTKK